MLASGQAIPAIGTRITYLSPFHILLVQCVVWAGFHASHAMTAIIREPYAEGGEAFQE